MLFFADTVQVSDIAALGAAGLLDGVTTNPSLIARAGRPLREVAAEIAGLTAGPVSVEVLGESLPQMLAEAEVLAAIAPNICIKLPMTLEGLKACTIIRRDMQRAVNVTLCFTAAQALLAAKAGASYVSPFMGRLEDSGGDGLQLIADIRQIYDRYGFKTKVLAASVRHGGHVAGAALAGADAVTAPVAVLMGLADHSLTRAGLAQFARDGAATEQRLV